MPALTGPTPPADLSPSQAALAQRHLRLGWWAIALFAAAGLALETLHAVKSAAYLDAPNDTRRLMWTLAHAHGTLLGLVHLGFAATLRLAVPAPASVGSASTALLAATVLLPLGFFLGGVQFYAGDPGLGVVLVPAGAVLLVYAAVIVARALSPGWETGGRRRR